MNMGQVFAVFSTLMVLSLGYYGPTTLQRKWILIMERGSWVDMAYTCKILFNGSLLTEESDSVSTAIQYFKEEVLSSFLVDDVWIGLFVADLESPEYKWLNSCNTHNLSVFSEFNTNPATQPLNSDQRCVFRNSNMTMWDFGSCTADQYNGFCEQYFGPCRYDRDVVSGSCTRGIAWEGVREVPGLSECEAYCSSIAPMTIGYGECWAVTYVPIPGTNFGDCYPAVGINPFQFDVTEPAWYENSCTHSTIGNQETKVSWKRCFIKPTAYFGPIIHSNYTGLINPNDRCVDTNTTTTNNLPETTTTTMETTNNLPDTTTTTMETTNNLPDTTTTTVETTNNLPETTTTTMETTNNLSDTTTTTVETTNNLPETTATTMETTNNLPDTTTTTVQPPHNLPDTTTTTVETTNNLPDTTTTTVETTHNLPDTTTTTVETTNNLPDTTTTTVQPPLNLPDTTTTTLETTHNLPDTTTTTVETINNLQDTTTTTMETTYNLPDTTTTTMETTYNLPDTTTTTVQPPHNIPDTTTTTMETTHNLPDTTTTTMETTHNLPDTTTTTMETTYNLPDTTTTTLETTYNLPDTTTTTMETTTTVETTRPTLPMRTTTTTASDLTYQKTTTRAEEGSGIEQTTYVAASIAECACVCIENENMTLTEKTSELKKETTINKEETAAHTRTLQCASDDRASAKGVGIVLGVGIMTVVIVLVSIGDIITLSHFIISKLRQ